MRIRIVLFCRVPKGRLVVTQAILRVEAQEVAQEILSRLERRDIMFLLLCPSVLIDVCLLPYSYVVPAISITKKVFLLMCWSI